MWLYQLFEGTADSFRWRSRSVQPTFEEAVGRDRQVFAQYVVSNRANGDLLGYVCGYGADLESRIIYVAAILHPAVRGDPRSAEGLYLFIDDLFTRLCFHKVYVEVLEFNESLAVSLRRLGFVQEGRLVDHAYYSGRLWDLNLLAMYDSSWVRWARKPLISPGSTMDVGADQLD